MDSRSASGIDASRVVTYGGIRVKRKTYSPKGTSETRRRLAMERRRLDEAVCFPNESLDASIYNGRYWLTEGLLLEWV
jgi:hypothetical protein